MRKNLLSMVLAGVAAGWVLWSGAVLAETARADKPCVRAAPGTSLCGKVDTTLHTCVQHRNCDKKTVAKKRGKGGFGFLSRLFI